MDLMLTSTAFTAGASIPAKYTCDGANVSPPLSWSDVPPGTKSLALIVDDPDAPDPVAPQRTWVHWVVYDISPDAAGLPEGAGQHALPGGARMGSNDWSKTSYGGPCPPIGRHRYFHKLYALDVVLPELAHPTKAALEKAMQHHIVGKAELIGTYERK
jgi:Raf kinase inhibitor-like YbhB/YbcL family protein